MSPFTQLRDRVTAAVPAGWRERVVWAARGLWRGLAWAWSETWAVALGIATAVVLFTSAGHDDSHITMWSAYALAEFGEIVNHSGDRVEQSSSLLHTIVLALSYGITGIRLPWLSYGLGIVFAALTVIRLPRLVGLEKNAGPLRLAIATAPLLTYWALGGLETTLFCWVSIEFLIHVAAMLRPRAVEARAWVGPVLWSVLLALTRPEAPLIAMCALAAVIPFAWWRDRRCGLRAAGLLAINVLIGLLLVKWRLDYFGDPFPHPVSAKIGSPGSALGWQAWLGTRQLFNLFLRADGLPLFAGLVAGVLGLGRDLRNRDATRPLVTAFGGAYLAFIVCVGGDWMYGGRFLAHAAPILLALLFAEFDVESWPRRRAWVLAIALLFANLFQAVSFSARESTGRPLWNAWQVLPSIEANAGTEDFAWVELVNKPHGRDAVFLKEFDPVLDRIIASEGKVSLLSVQAGMIMYHVAREHYGEIEFIDHAGLVSRHFDPLVTELGIPHNRLGLDWRLSDTFAIGEYRAGPEFEPDVIFDLYRHSYSAAQRNGYVVIFIQEGKLLSEYTPPEEEPEEEEEEPAQETPKLSPEEATIERLRERFKKARDEREVEFFGATKGFYQFIAVRRDLAQKLGWERYESGPDGNGGRPRTRIKRWNWNEIRTEHMRYFEDEDEEREEGEAPAKKGRRRPETSDASSGAGDDGEGADEDEKEDEDEDDGTAGETTRGPGEFEDEPEDEPASRDEAD